MRNAISFGIRPNEHTKTRIMATVGPKTVEYATLRRMVDAGATFFRFNGAHIVDDDPDSNELTYEQAAVIAQHIRRLRAELRHVIGIYFDLGGPKIRVLHVLGVDLGERDNPGQQRPNPLHPAPGERVTLHQYDAAGDRRFREAVHAYREGHRPSTADPWEDSAWVRGFFTRPGQQSKYELMFGEGVRLSDFTVGKIINLKDGWCSIRIVSNRHSHIECEVTYRDSKFEFRPQQGANPYRHVFPYIITDKDVRDISLALRLGADVISLSFVCSHQDAATVRDHIRVAKANLLRDDDFMKTQSPIYRDYLNDRFRIPVFGKIETAFAVDYDLALQYAALRETSPPDERRRDPLSEIADHFDGLMVARGDLALEVEKYEVPGLQRRIIKAAKLRTKPVIVATEMLESMKRGDTSTRAEISDINTAVHQEADILMLSGETASTRGRPEDAVAEMRKAIMFSERERLADDGKKNFESLANEREKELQRYCQRLSIPSEPAIARLSQGIQICLSAKALRAPVILASAQEGDSVREIAYFRPRQKIVAITDNILTGVRLLQMRGVFPVVMERPLTRTVDEFLDIANQIHRDIGLPIPPRRHGRGTFRVPGLIRIMPLDPIANDERPRPNSIHEFTLSVKPMERKERDRKYLLSEQSHRRLDLALRKTAVSWRLIEQRNAYFADTQGVLSAAKVMIRMRTEQLLDFRVDPREEPAQTATKVLLTFKGPGVQTEMGDEQRPEQQFDITREQRSDRQDLSFADVADYYKEYLWKRWESVLRPAYENWRSISYELQATMPNRRLACEMPNGLVLELDQASFGATSDEIVDHELEVAIPSGSAETRILEEYVHDKLASVGTPVVHIPGYPPKIERAYAPAGRLDELRTTQIWEDRQEAANLTNAAHEASCPLCQAVRAT